MSKIINILITTVMAMAMTSGMVLATNNYNSTQNQASYWGDSCVKTDYANGGLYFSTRDKSVTKVVIKGGTTNKVYTESPFVDLTAENNPNSGKPYDISHVIVCSDEQVTEKPEVCAYDSSLPADHEDCKPAEVCQYDSSITPDDPNCIKPATDEPSGVGGIGDTSDDSGYTSSTSDSTPQVLAEGVTELPKTGTPNPLYQFLLVTGVMTVILSAYELVKVKIQ